MVNMDKIFGKMMANLWLAPIIGGVLILIESILSIENVVGASFSITVSIIVILSVLLSRKDVHGTGFIVGLCGIILLLSPITISGFEIGYLLIIVGVFFVASGGIIHNVGIFFFYVAIGAIILDIILFFLAK